MQSIDLAKLRAIRAERRRMVMDLLRQGHNGYQIYKLLRDTQYAVSDVTIYDDIKALREQSQEHATCVVCGHEFIPSKGV